MISECSVWVVRERLAECGFGMSKGKMTYVGGGVEVGWNEDFRGKWDGNGNGNGNGNGKAEHQRPNQLYGLVVWWISLCRTSWNVF